MQRFEDKIVHAQVGTVLFHSVAPEPIAIATHQNGEIQLRRVF